MIMKKLCQTYPQLMFYYLQPFEKNQLIGKEIYRKFLMTSNPYLISTMEKFYESLAKVLVNFFFFLVVIFFFFFFFKLNCVLGRFL